MQDQGNGGEQTGERGYRGQTPRDTPPGSVPGGSYGGGGGYQQGGYSSGEYEGGDWPGRGTDEWRRGYGGYGVSGRGPTPESGWRGGPAQPGRGDQEYGHGEAEYGMRGQQRAWEGTRGERGRPHSAEPWRAAEEWAVPGPHTGRGPRDYQRPESAIREDVCERLTRHGQVDASGISVSVENGEVVLEGDVDSRSVKRMAEDAAESVTGVHDVHNRLRVRRDVRDTT